MKCGLNKTFPKMYLAEGDKHFCAFLYLITKNGRIAEHAVHDKRKNKGTNDAWQPSEEFL